MWLHLLFNSVLPFTALLYLNAAIYKRLVSVFIILIMEKMSIMMIMRIFQLLSPFGSICLPLTNCSFLALNLKCLSVGELGS